MDKNLNVAIAPKDSIFQVRINSEIKREVECIYAKTEMTLTNAADKLRALESAISGEYGGIKPRKLSKT